MKVNAKQVSLEQPVTLLDYLKSQNYDPARVAVELNFDIISKDTFGGVVLHDEDSLEIVGFVGGG